MLSLRQWIAVFCVAALFLAAVTHQPDSGSFLAILTPLWFFFSLILLPPAPRASFEPRALRPGFDCILPSRAPPAA